MSFVKDSILIKEGKPSIYLYPNYHFNEEENNKSISILLFGKNGSGKTTLINSVVNAIMKVKFEDPFRYVVIKEEIEGQKEDQNQISEVGVYNIFPPKGRNLPPIKIIDTPDFDSTSLEEDEKIFEKIIDFLKNKIDIKINAICFVIKSKRIKLSSREEYIYKRVLNLFGNNFKENYLFMLTFCDGGKPRIRKNLESNKSLFKDIIPYIKKPYYYTFNFSAIFTNNSEAKEYYLEFTKAFWKIAMDELENFLNRIKLMNSISLTLTKEIIDSNNNLAQTLKKIENEKEELSLSNDDEDYEILRCIFPSLSFNPKNIPTEIKNLLLYIPTERKIKNSEINEKIPCLFKNNAKSQNILIIFHCNGANMFEIFESISELGEKYNINLLIPEYPGYSIYDSPLSSAICLKNSLIIYDFILNNIKNITEKNIYILGRSLGTGPAIYLSSKRHPAATFLISPYSTFASVSSHNKEDYQLEALSNHFRSTDYINKIINPVLFIHGKNDDIIDYQNSQELYNKCKKDIIKDISLIENMNHNFDKQFLLTKIIPVIIEFTEKYCPSYKMVNHQNENNNIIIDLDKKFYGLLE